MEKSYLVIDLEMCKVVKSQRRPEFPFKQEIIQIGAVLLDEDFAEISRFSTYVKPQYGYIDWFIADLTGIHDSHVRRAPELPEALQMMMGWLNGRQPEICAWSENDYKQLHREVSSKHIAVNGIEEFLQEERWHDYQISFDERYHMGRCVSLKEALDLMDLGLEGRAHDGLEDAVNTGRLIAKMELEPEYRLPVVFENARREEKVEKLSFSMGNLFAGLALDLPA